MLLAQEPPDGGQVLLQGRNVHEVPRRHLVPLLRKIGIVSQSARLVPEWTLFDNVALPLVLAGKDRWLIKKKVSQVLDNLGLHHRAHVPCRGMDASESKRAEIARALVHNPLILLADEPLDGLNPGERSVVAALIGELNVGGSTCMALSRNPAELLAVPGVRRVQITQGKFQELLTF
jgi:cell division transport system ATP-binding protein